MISKQSNVFATILFIILIAQFRVGESKNLAGNDCPKQCKADECQQPNNCLSGTIKDHCDCCFVCASREGERCFNEALRSKVPQSYEQYQDCGSELECRLRTDLSAEDESESICFCIKNTPICGSDGITYDNVCQFTEARYKKRNDLSKIDEAPCKIKPVIISGPEDVTENIGESLTMTCEAKGWPIPRVDWKVIQDGVELPLPTDDVHVSVNSRGGPEEYGVTGWMQISQALRRHTGHYVCVAINEIGEQRASADLLVGNFNRKASTTVANNMLEDEL